MNVVKYARLFFVAAALLAAVPRSACAQTDEIQVYDASIAPQGKFNLTWHNNFTPDGLKTPAFPGAIIPDRSFNGVTEWAYGATDWLELGLYLPLYSISKNHDATINGGKIRLLFVKPHAADRTFFYGANFEFSYNATYWEPVRFTSEIRPIIGVHLHPVDIIVNPILDNSFRGGFASFDFAPAGRIAYNFTQNLLWPPSRIPTLARSARFCRPILNHTKSGESSTVSRKSGVSKAGLASGSHPHQTKITLKLMFSRDLN